MSIGDESGRAAYGRKIAQLAHLFFGLASGRLIAALLQGVTLVLLARGLSPTDFAAVSGAMGIFLFGVAIADFGVSTAITRETAGGELGRIAEFMALNRRLSFLVAIAGSTLSLFVWNQLGGLGLQLLPLGLWMGIERLAETATAWHLGRRNARLVLASIVVRKALPLLGTTIAFVMAESTIVLGMSFGYVAGSAVALLLTRRAHIGRVLDAAQPETSSSWGSIRLTIPFWFNSVAAQSRQLDVLVVGAVAGPGAAAAFAPASRLISPLRLIPTTLAQALLPFVAGRRPSRSQLATLMGATVLGNAAFFGTIFLILPAAIEIVLGAEYLESVPVLRILVIGLIVAGVCSVQTTVAQGIGLERQVGIVSMCSACITLGLIALGALWAGGVGAAWGIVIVYLLQATVLSLLIFVPRSTKEALGRV